MPLHNHKDSYESSIKSDSYKDFFLNFVVSLLASNGFEVGTNFENPTNKRTHENRTFLTRSN